MSEHKAANHKTPLVDELTLPLITLKNFITLAMEGVDGEAFRICDITETLLENAFAEIERCFDEVEKHHGRIMLVEYGHTPENKRADIAGKCIGVEVLRNGSPVSLVETNKAETVQAK